MIKRVFFCVIFILFFFNQAYSQFHVKPQVEVFLSYDTSFSNKLIEFYLQGTDLTGNSLNYSKKLKANEKYFFFNEVENGHYFICLVFARIDKKHIAYLSDLNIAVVSDPTGIYEKISHSNVIFINNKDYKLNLNIIASENMSGFSGKNDCHYPFFDYTKISFYYCENRNQNVQISNNMQAGNKLSTISASQQPLAETAQNNFGCDGSYGFKVIALETKCPLPLKDWENSMLKMYVKNLYVSKWEDSDVNQNDNKWNIYGLGEKKVVNEDGSFHNELTFGNTRVTYEVIEDARQDCVSVTGGQQCKYDLDYNVHIEIVTVIMSNDALNNLQCPEGMTCPNFADAKTRYCFHKAIKTHESVHCMQWNDNFDDEEKINAFRNDMQMDPLCDETPPLCGCGVQIADPCSEEFSRVNHGFRGDITASVAKNFIYRSGATASAWETESNFFDQFEFYSCMQGN